MKIHLFLLLIMVTFASERKENDAENLILVKIEEDEYTKVHKKTSQYIGVSYSKERNAIWQASRRSKNEKKNIYNGCYKDEETAAHASDTLARKLMKNGEHNHKLNFPHDHTEVNAEEKTLQYIGVSYSKERTANWKASRWSKTEKRQLYNGSYKDGETAAHASDTLARKLMKNGEPNHKLNFPDEDTEVYAEEEPTSSIYFGVSYNKNSKLWIAQRWNKTEKKKFYNGSYKNEVTAVHASDTLARKLMENGEQNQILNFPDDVIERQTNKRKRSENEDLGYSQNKQSSK